MSTITPSFDKNGQPRFRVRVKYKGEVRSKTIHTSQADAEAWAAEQLLEMKHADIIVAMPKPLTIGEMINGFVSDFPGFPQSVIDSARVLANFMPDRVTAGLVLETFPDMGQAAVFLEYVIEWGRHNGVFVAQNPVAAARREFDRLPFRPVADSEMELLIAKALANDENKYIAALLSVIMDGALKQVEALRLRRQDFNLKAGELNFEGRVIPLSAATIAFIKDRIEYVSGDELFSGISIQMAKSRLSDYCKFLKLDTITFTDMRFESMYRLTLKHGFDRAWGMFGRKSTANTAWLPSAVARITRLVESMGYAPNFTM